MRRAQQEIYDDVPVIAAISRRQTTGLAITTRCTGRSRQIRAQSEAKSAGRIPTYWQNTNIILLYNYRLGVKRLEQLWKIYDRSGRSWEILLLRLFEKLGSK